MGIRIELHTHELIEAAHLEYEVYLQAGYISPNKYCLVLENRNYPSHYHVAAYDGSTLAGAARFVVDPNPRFGLFSLSCFKPFTIWPEAASFLERTDPTRIVQIGTTVVREGYRGGSVVFPILRWGIDWMLENDTIQYAVTTIDERFFKALNRWGIALQPMGPSLHYMGSTTVPAYLDMDSLRNAEAIPFATAV